MAVSRLALVAAVLLAAVVSATAVDGIDGRIEDAPWMAQMVDYDKWDVPSKQNVKDQICGGTIIDAKHILVGAHCWNSKRIEDPWTMFGFVVGASERLGAPGKLYRVRNLKTYDTYESWVGYLGMGKRKQNGKYDVSVAELMQPIEFNDAVKPIRIGSARPKAGTTVHFGGWGRSSFDYRQGASSDRHHADVVQPEKNLKLASAQVLSNQECQTFLAPNKEKMHPDAPKALICASSDKSVCHGDGGGWWVQGQDGTPELIGLSHGCDQQGKMNLGFDLFDKDVAKFLEKNGVFV